jgi:hypothetical protein
VELGIPVPGTVELNLDYQRDRIYMAEICVGWHPLKPSDSLLDMTCDYEYSAYCTRRDTTIYFYLRLNPVLLAKLAFHPVSPFGSLPFSGTIIYYVFENRNLERLEDKNMQCPQ